MTPVPLLLAAVFLLLAHLTALPAWAWEAVVTRVQDGDTLLVAPYGTKHTDISVRLYGIDAPELGQEGGRESLNALKQLVRSGDSVSIIPLNEDRYARVVGLVIHEGRTLNYEQVLQGQAWVYARYCKARFCREWTRTEKAARKQHRGLWQDNTPLAPWKWRKQNKNSTLP